MAAGLAELVLAFCLGALALWLAARPARARGGAAARRGPGDDDVLVCGISVGLPGEDRAVFASDNIESVLAGESRISELDAGAVASLLKRNVVQLRKGAGGGIEKVAVETPAQTIGVAARLGHLDLAERYGIAKPLCATMGCATQVAVAAGLEALRDAGLVEGRYGDAASWRLAEGLCDGTGIIYVSSFPALDAAAGELARYAEAKSAARATFSQLADALRPKCGGDAVAAAALESLVEAYLAAHGGADPHESQHYAFDRKFLFKVLVLANAQLAQLVGARGPNIQTNAACAGTTQAIGVAHDLLRAGRCDRVVVIAGDDASGDALLPWLGNGFVALGAASLARNATECARPFDARRSGMVLGAAGVGLVLERRCAPRASPRSRYACRLVETRYSNSAFHGAAMDRAHIATELSAFLSTLEAEHGIRRESLAKHGCYFSHETGTHATPSSSCAANEVAALRAAFGARLLSFLVIVNTKCLTGHPMGAGVEDAVAAAALATGRVPPVPSDTRADAHFATPLRFRTDAKAAPRKDLRFALRFAAGFGSQVAFFLYAKLDDDDEDDADDAGENGNPRGASQRQRGRAARPPRDRAAPPRATEPGPGEGVLLAGCRDAKVRQKEA
ncbi:thiolase-like protein [Pelagophyceae sp. CCMP2097]|nr:thiolase-like protein [Pelagophyceae sp. CCMP2097]